LDRNGAIRESGRGGRDLDLPRGRGRADDGDAGAMIGMSFRGLKRLVAGHVGGIDGRNRAGSRHRKGDQVVGGRHRHIVGIDHRGPDIRDVVPDWREIGPVPAV